MHQLSKYQLTSSGWPINPTVFNVYSITQAIESIEVTLVQEVSWYSAGTSCFYYLYLPIDELIKIYSIIQAIETDEVILMKWVSYCPLYF